MQVTPLRSKDNTSGEGVYYVYVYRDPRNGKPIYVGLGKGKRAFKHWKKKANNIFFQNVLDKIRSLGMSPSIEFAAIDLPFKCAAKLEKELIALYGRRDLNLGTLCNLTDGGDGCVGLVVSDYARRVHSECNVKRFSDSAAREEHGKKISRVFAARTDEELAIVRQNVKASRTPEVRAKISAGVKEKWAKHPERYLKSREAVMAPEVRKRQAETLRKTLASPEQRQKKREISNKLVSDPAYRKKLSEAVAKKWQDPEFRSRMAAAHARCKEVKLAAIGLAVGSCSSSDI